MNRRTRRRLAEASAETIEVQVTDAAEKALLENGILLEDIVAAMKVEKVTIHTVRAYVKQLEEEKETEPPVNEDSGEDKTQETK